MEHISKSIETKKVVWFEEANQYLVVDDSFYGVFNRYLKGMSVSNLLSYCRVEFSLSNIDAKEIISSCKKLQDQLLNNSKMVTVEEPLELKLDTDRICYNYCFNHKKISVQFSSVELAELIHPKYAHLSRKYFEEIHSDHFIVVTEIDKHIALVVDGILLGKWTVDGLHFLQGKFAMALLNCVNEKGDDDWLGVLHASAVSFKNQSIVFLGESGNGKSTATTLLSTNGFELLADDFVPIDASTKKTVSFPAAISIKESLLNEMELNFPQLKSSQLRIKDSTTNYKYLYPVNENHLSTSKKCKALVFIKYEAGVEDKLEEISKLEALECLIPDSWISPKKENANSFLDWIISMPCYKMYYSNNDKMIALIDKLMRDEI